VTAQGIQTEKTFTGLFCINRCGNVLQQKPESDVARILSGKIPGVSITQTGGIVRFGNKYCNSWYTLSPAPTTFVCHWRCTFNTNTNSQGDYTTSSGCFKSLLDLDPKHIESISVLKGLSATVCMVSREKGVILVTTKNGSDQKEGILRSPFLNRSSPIKCFVTWVSDNYGNGFQNSFGFFFSNWGRTLKMKPWCLQPGLIRIRTHGSTTHRWSLRFRQFQIGCTVP